MDLVVNYKVELMVTVYMYMYVQVHVHVLCTLISWHSYM